MTMNRITQSETDDKPALYLGKIPLNAFTSKTDEQLKTESDALTAQLEARDAEEERERLEAERLEQAEQRRLLRENARLATLELDKWLMERVRARNGV